MVEQVSPFEPSSLSDDSQRTARLQMLLERFVALCWICAFEAVAASAARYYLVNEVYWRDLLLTWLRVEELALALLCWWKIRYACSRWRLFVGVLRIAVNLVSDLLLAEGTKLEVESQSHRSRYCD